MSVDVVINQKEYLKRYLSKGDEKPKKKQKKKKQSVVKRTMVIVDDDVDIKSLAPAAEAVEMAEEELYDDAPTVAGMIDERPEEEKKLEAYRKSTKWKGLNDDTKDSNLADRNIFVAKKIPNRHDSDSDLSPTRSKTRANQDHDVSPVRSRKRHNSDSDLSPPRSKQISTRTVSKDPLTDDRGQQRKKRHDSDSDLSPQRSKHISTVSKGHPADDRKQRIGKQNDSDSDLSPPRTVKRLNSNSDFSPPRSMQRLEKSGSVSSKRIGSSHNSGRTRQRHDSDSDLSPNTHRGDGSDSDLSPVRSKSIDEGDSDLSPVRRDQKDSDDPPRSGTDGKMNRTLSGQRAGLQDARTLKAENEASRRRQDRLFESLAADESGRNKTTIFRDKSGKKRDLAREREQERKEEVKKAEENEKFKEWRQGVAQKQNQEQLVENAMKEMAKPLARYGDDEDLDSLLRDQEREGDPMLAMIRKKKCKELELAGVKEKSSYKGPAPPPNRFGIPPGYRWDGVDRSNGFEKIYFARMANKKAMQEVKYKWSVEDM